MSNILTHFYQLQQLNKQSDWVAQLDCTTMKLYFINRNNIEQFVELTPLFLHYENDQFSFTQELAEKTESFIGWTSYKAPTISWTANKLETKEKLQALGFQVPAFSLTPENFEKDFLIKPTNMSFSQAITGPYKAKTVIQKHDLSKEQMQGELYCEEFIQGEIVKFWFWGDKPVCFEQVPMPYVTGDGRRQIRDLIEKDYAYPYLNFNRIQAVLKYFNKSLEDVLSPGEMQIFDYTYATAGSHQLRYYSQEFQKNDNRLLKPKQCDESAHKLFAPLYDKVTKNLWPCLFKETGYEFLFDIDLMMTPSGELYVLELNMVPEVPVEAYAFMLSKYKLQKPSSLSSSNLFS